MDKIQQEVYNYIQFLIECAIESVNDYMKKHGVINTDLYSRVQKLTILGDLIGSSDVTEAIKNWEKSLYTKEQKE